MEACAYFLLLKDYIQGHYKGYNVKGNKYYLILSYQNKVEFNEHALRNEFRFEIKKSNYILSKIKSTGVCKNECKTLKLPISLFPINGFENKQ